MKISGIGNTRAAPSARRSERAREAGDQRFSTLVQETPASSALAGAQAVGPVAALLAAQEVPDALEEQRQAFRRGNDLLDQLEEIRLALLLGRLPRTSLERLSVMVAERRGPLQDPELAAVLDDIELRAAVELAKLER